MGSRINNDGLISKTYSDRLKNFDFPGEIVCIRNPEGHYKYISPSVRTILGYSPEKLIGTSFFQYLHPEDAERIKRMAGEELMAETGIKYRCRKKDGSFTWVKTKTAPLVGGDGSIKELLSITRDIGQREQNEEPLVGDIDIYRQLFMNSSVAKILVDLATGNILEANPAAIEFYGYSPEELQTMTLYQFSAEAPEKIRQWLKQVTGNYCEKAAEFEHRLRDGNLRAVEIYPAIVRMGKSCLLLCSIIDVTERRENNAKFSAFAEAVLGTSFIINEEGRHLNVFGPRDAFPMPKEQIHGKTVYEVLEKDDADFVLNEVRQVIASGKSRTSFHEMKIGKEKRFFLGHTVPLTVVDGKKTVAVIVTDVTDQRQTGKMMQAIYEQRRRSSLINDVLNGTVPEDDNLIYNLRQMGLDIGLPLFCCMVLSKGNKHLSTIEAQKKKEEVVAALNDHSQWIAWDCREGIGVFCHNSTDNNGKEHSKEIATFIKNKLVDYNFSLKICMGVSDSHTGIDGLKKSCRQALSAAIAARCRSAEGEKIVHYREAGIFQVITGYLGKDAAKEYVELHIGKLLSYDLVKKTDYLSTLEELLRGASVQEIADRQFLHPKTVIFRHKRIAKILNVDLSDYQTKLALSLALQLYKLNMEEQ